MPNTGRALRVNLQRGAIQTFPLPYSLLSSYLGGRGISTALLYTLVGPETSARSPKMPIFFAAGPLSGTPAFAATTLTITTRSLLTGLIAHSWAVGQWAERLKGAGYDMVVISGQAESWSYLIINEEGAELRPADSLLGLDTIETYQRLREELGDEYSILALGPAGERGLPYAAIVADGRYMAEPAGTGGVLGLKKIKAIAVRGAEQLQPADERGFASLLESIRERVTNDELAEAMRQFGSSYYLNLANEAGALTPRNGQDAVFSRFLALSRTTLAARGRREDHGCPGCPMPCYSDFVRRGGDPLPRPELEALAGFGVRCGLGSVDPILAANERCLRLGLDVNATAASIAFLMECRQQGLTSQYDLNWGDEEAVLDAIDKIAVKEGVGGLLSLGPWEMSEIFFGSSAYAPIANKLPQSPIDPRAAQGWALHLATAAIGGDARAAMPFYEWLPEPPPWLVGEETHTPEIVDGKAARLVWHERFTAALDAAGLCRKLALMGYQVSPAELAQLLTSDSGMEITAADIAKIGERITTVERLCALQWGAGDGLPQRWSEEALPSGPAAGRLPALETLLQRYYERHGWDENGQPSDERLHDLGIVPPDKRTAAH